MKKTSAVAAICVLLSAWALAQNYPKVEVFGGYSYLNFDVPSTTVTKSERLNTNGWEASASFDFLRHLGAEADFSGHYKSSCGGVSGLSCNEYSFLFGPKASFGNEGSRLTGFVHGLFGEDRISAGILGVSASNNSIGIAAGGGVDYWVTRHIGVRLGQVDYLFTRHLSNLDVPVQHNVRASAGIVFMIGGRSTPASVTPPARATPPARVARAAMPIPALGIAVSPRGDGKDGAEITEVAPGGVGEMAMLHVGDIINSVDGKAVRTPMELAAELSNRAAGSKIRLGYMFRTAITYYQKETVVILGGNH